MCLLAALAFVDVTCPRLAVPFGLNAMCWLGIKQGASSSMEGTIDGV